MMIDHDEFWGDRCILEDFAKNVVEMQHVVQNVKATMPPRFYWDDPDRRTIKERLADDWGTIKGASLLGRGPWGAPKIKAKTTKQQLNNNDLIAGERQDLTRPGPRPGEVEIPPRFDWDDTDLRTIKERSRND